MLGAEANEVIQLAQIGQFSLHLFILPLHSLRRLLIRAQLIDTISVFLAAACAHWTTAIALGLPFSAGHTGAKGDRPLRLLD